MISDAGFFADGKWHGMAKAMRCDQGEELIGAAIDRDGFAGLLNSGGEIFGEDDIDAYWAPFAESAAARRRDARVLPLDGLGEARAVGGEARRARRADVAALGGRGPVRAARRGATLQREIPGAGLVAIEGGGHFVFDAARERSIAEVLRFLGA